MRVILSLFLSLNVFAIKEDFFVEAGIGPGLTRLETRSGTDKAITFAVSTNLGFHAGDFDIMASSYIQIGEFAGTEIERVGTVYSGETSMMSLSYGPLIRYKSDFKAFNWRFYTEGGFLWGMMTLKPDANNFPDWHKLNLLQKGHVVGIGFIEDRQDYAKFVALSFKSLKANKMRYVQIENGGRNTTELQQTGLTHPVTERSISIYFGFEFL